MQNLKELLKILLENEVDFVLIGGFAAELIVRLSGVAAVPHPVRSPTPGLLALGVPRESHGKCRTRFSITNHRDFAVMRTCHALNKR